VSKDAKEIELEPAGVVERPTPPGGIAAIYSCSQGEKSFEHPDLQHGVFANFLIEAFSGKGDIDNDGEITLNELETFSVKATQRYARNVFGKPQTPERRGETRGLVSLAKLGRSVPASPTPTIPEKMPNNSATPQKAASGQLSDGNRAYEVSSNNSLGLKLVWIPSGTFTMGSPSSEAGRDGDESQVSVTLTKGYWLGQTEVTQGQWKQLMGTEPWKGQPYVKEGANYPATYVSWEDAMEFCQKLTEAERRAGRLAANREYTLPTEAQWEYACRAGTTTAYSFGASERELSKYGWWGGIVGDGNAKTEQYAHEVGKKLANPAGLYDMHGNVWEWCRDWYGGKLPGGTNPLISSGGSNRGYRGGGWSDDATYARSANRSRDAPGSRYGDLGFRLASSSVE
jgi:formylglycine-generating enzyme required for sulfatase activity